MTCPACQAPALDDAEFCTRCGIRLVLACPACRTPTRPGDRFCRRCGRNLEPPPPPPAPKSYTPAHLAEKILTSRASLEGERKQVTVLFADLKGSMELLVDRDPEEARKLLDPVLERMMEAVHRYEGTVNQVMGDGIMALFGAPLAHEDHALRACYAALAMQSAIRRYTEEARHELGVAAQIRVGLNSGEVVVRAIGNDLRMDYTAVGQTTHLAARMEQMAPPGSIRLTADTLRLVEGMVQVSSLGLVPIKGLAEPVEVFELIGAGPTRTRLQAAVARGLTPFVGRDAEVAALRRALEKARAGHGQVVALVGEPGVGKSRLIWEFTHSSRTHGWLILESGAVSYGRATAYLPVIDLLKAYFQIEARDAIQRVFERVTGKLLSRDERLKDAIPPVLSLLEALPPDDPFRALDPSQRRSRTLEALRRLLLQESQRQPLLLVFEDLQWADSETQVFLDSLVEGLPTAPILLLVSYRPGYQHGWSQDHYALIRLDPLSPAGIEELLRALLGDDSGLRPLKHLLIERTEGNPFFLEESVRTLVETRVLDGERGAHRLAKPLETIQVPATVQAVLGARIDRLPPEDKRLLQSAAVLGRVVPYTLFQGIAELPEEALGQGLARLQAAEFLYETSLFPELQYSFKHALTHEVAYGSLLRERQRALHARIVAAIEAHYPDRLAEHVDRLAHHAFRGEVWDKALPYLRQAGTKAAAHSANREAVACFEHALGALAHLPERREVTEQAIDLRLDLRGSLMVLGELGRALDCLREAEALARGLGDQRRLGWVASFMSNYFFLLGDHDRAVESGQRALSTAAALGDFALRVGASYYLGMTYHALGDYRRAIECLSRNVEALEGDLVLERFGLAFLPSVTSRAYLVWCLAEQGDFERGIAGGKEAVEIAAAVDHPGSLISAHCGVGICSLARGDFPAAISVLERGLALCQTWNQSLMFPLVASALGNALALSGRVAEALPLLEQAAEQTAARRAGHSRQLALLSEAYLLAGRVEEAARLAGRALDLSRERKERGHEGWALRLLGKIASERDPPDIERAEAHYRQARAAAEELGMGPLLAHSHLGLGGLYLRAGRRQEARAGLQESARLFSSMGMAFWLARAEDELAKVGSR